MIKFTYYIIAWVALLFGWMINSEVWVYGLIGGWFFHAIVFSIISHKYLTHKTFKVSKAIHPVLVFIACLGINGSPLEWVAMHRLHHKTSDQKGDPHDPNNIGILKSLMPMLQFAFPPFPDLSGTIKSSRDLISDKYIMITHKHHLLIISLFYTLLGLISLNLLLGFMVATGVGFVGLFFTTFVYHKKIPLLHYRNHSTTDKSYNNWLTTILFPGEAYHNNHHNDASKYDAGERWFELDLTKYIIKLIKE